MIDLPMMGKKFTWFGSNGKRSRLDRFLLDNEIVAACGGWFQEGLKGSVSNHLPVNRCCNRSRLLSVEEWSIDLRAVEVVLEIFKKPGWTSKSTLVVELDKKMLIKWLVNMLQRPWGIARNLAEFDSLVCDCLSFRFQLADLMKSSLGDTSCSR
ncbi:hypothetical protein GQ457_01G010290 [Hibiscus cannabinus]